MELFFFSLNSFFLPIFFSFLPAYLLALHTYTLHSLTLLASCPLRCLLCCCFRHHCFANATLLSHAPSYFCHHCLLLPMCFCLFLPSPSALAYFCHRHLFSPLSLAPTSLFPLTFAIATYSHHCHLLLPPYFHLLLPSPPLQVPRLLAYLIVYLFELQAHPPCLVFPPFFICIRGGG